MNVGFLVAALPGCRPPALASSACLLSGHVQPKTIFYPIYCHYKRQLQNCWQHLINYKQGLSWFPLINFWSLTFRIYCICSSQTLIFSWFYICTQTHRGLGYNLESSPHPSGKHSQQGAAGLGMPCHATKAGCLPGKGRKEVSPQAALVSSERQQAGCVFMQPQEAIGLWCDTSWKQIVSLLVCVNGCCILKNAATCYVDSAQSKHKIASLKGLFI